MARPNPRKRAKLRQLDQSILVHKARLDHDDSKFLQRGSPKTSSGSKFRTNGQYATQAPRETSLEGRGPAWYKDGPKNVFQGDK